ncbi:MAG: hypothetical protein ACFHVJ_17880 [Aestuariibacter sp.]
MIKQSLLKVGILAVLLVTSAMPKAQDAKSVVVAVTYIKELLEEDNHDLPYARVLSIIKERSSRKISYIFGPSPRTSKMLREKRADCLFPGSLLSPLEGGPLIESYAVNVAKAYLMGFSKIHLNDILSPDSTQMTIGFRRGNTFGGNIDQLRHHSLVDLNDDVQLAGLLAKGRIDAMLSYLPDAEHLLQTNIEKPILYGEDSLFHTQNDSFLCSENGLSQGFIAEVNSIISEMKNNGELQSILGSAYLAP